MSIPIIRHCTIHTLVSAAPSFLFAYLGGWTQPSQIAGMISGIILFLICAIYLHLHGPIASISKYPIASKALKWAKNTRLVQALLIFPSYTLNGVFLTFTLIDMWAGVLANLATEQIGLPQGGGFPASEKAASFLFAQAFVATFIEGWILAALIGVIFLLIWMILHLHKKITSVKSP